MALRGPECLVRWRRPRNWHSGKGKNRRGARLFCLMPSAHRFVQLLSRRGSRGRFPETSFRAIRDGFALLG